MKRAHAVGVFGDRAERFAGVSLVLGILLLFVNPAFVEKAIAENDSVSDVFVYGIPMADGAPGEKDVVAAVVPANGNSFDPAAVFADCRQKLEKNFIPSYLQVMQEIPKTASEKPQERFCLEHFEQHPESIFNE